MFKKRSILLLIFQALLIMCVCKMGFSQDTIYVNDDSMGEISKYGARDSIYADIEKKQLHLYGEAFVETQDMNLKAGYILVDMNTEEISATFVYDKDSNLIEKPLFTMGGEEVEANTLKFNMRSKKAYIEAVKIKQDEMYLFMGRAKRQQNEDIHFVEGRFTTCDLDEPHYYFQLSKAVMVPNKRIVTGPMNLYIAGVPTPLGLPFSYIPQMDENDRSHGLLFPEIVPISSYGFGLNNIGYYIPINDYLQTSIYGTIYSRGSWGLRNKTEYMKRYGYKGDVDISYQQFKTGFPSKSSLNNVDFRWSHRQDPKANPKWNFNTNVNFISSNNTKNNLDPLNQNYFKNTLMSDINLVRSFPGKPYRVSAKISLSQNSQTDNIALTSPSINFSTNQFFPLKKLLKADIFQRLGVIYSIQGQNKSTFKDSLLRDGDFSSIGNQFMYGMRQQITIQTTGGVFKNALKLTPSVNYSTNLNFNQTRKTYDSLNNTTLTDTINKAGLAHALALNIAATSGLYTYYKFIGKSKPIIRHVLTPSVSFSYRPVITKNVTDSIGVNKTPVTYSPFASSVYAYSGSSRDQAILSFGVNNTFELKRKSEKDTITGFQKIRLIDAFSITGSYDLMKDSMNLSDLNLSLRISPFKWMNFVGTSTYTFYAWDENTNSGLSSYALSTNGKLGRTLRNSFATTITFTSKESRKEIEENKEQVEQNWMSDYNYFYLHPERIIDFDIPWKLNLSHQFNLTRNTAKSITNSDEFVKIQTLNIDGDISFTKRWKLGAVINVDLKMKKVTNAYFTLNRDMHCWALSFRWTPIGFNKSFLLTIRNTSSIFKDAKLDFRKPPAFL